MELLLVLGMLELVWVFCYYFVVVGGERGFSEVVFSELVSPDELWSINIEKNYQC